MSFDVTLTYGAANTPLTISGTVHPEGTVSSVTITVRLPKEHGTNAYAVRTTSTERVSVNVVAYHILAPSATPIIEVEALTGDFVHTVQVQARLADGPVVGDMCPMGCSITLAPTW